MASPNFRYTTRTYSYDYTIAAGSTTNGLIDMIGVPLIGIQFPDAMTSDVVYIDISTDGVNTIKAYNPYGVRMQAKVQPGGYVCIAPDDFRGVRYIRVTTNKTEREARSLTLFGRVDS